MAFRSPTDKSTITADGVYYRHWEGGRGVFRADGSFGSGTVTLSVIKQAPTSDEDTAGDYVTLGSDTTFTADGNGQFYLDGGAVIGIVVTGSTTPVIYATIATVN